LFDQGFILLNYANNLSEGLKDLSFNSFNLKKLLNNEN